MGAGKAESQKSEWSRKSELEPEKQKLGVRMEQKAGRQNLELIPNRNLRASKKCSIHRRLSQSCIFHCHWHDWHDCAVRNCYPL